GASASRPLSAPAFRDGRPAPARERRGRLPASAPPRGLRRTGGPGAQGGRALRASGCDRCARAERDLRPGAGVPEPLPPGAGAALAGDVPAATLPLWAGWTRPGPRTAD